MIHESNCTLPTPFFEVRGGGCRSCGATEVRRPAKETAQ